MSRIGKLPISLPAKVEVSVASDNVVTVKGPKGTLTQKIDPDIKIEMEGSTLVVTRPTEQKRHKALHGLYRALINNLVVGVSQGYTKEMESLAWLPRRESGQYAHPHHRLFAPDHLFHSPRDQSDDGHGKRSGSLDSPRRHR